MENVKIELGDHENEDHQSDIGSCTSKVMKDGASTLSEAIHNWAILALELKMHVNMKSLFKEELQDNDYCGEEDFFGFAPTFQCLPNMPSLISLPDQESLQPTRVRRSPSPASSVTPNSSHSTSRVPSPSISLPSTPHLSPSPSHSPTRPNPPSPSCPSSACHASIPPPHSSPLCPVRPPSSPASQPPSPPPPRPPPPSRSYTPDNQQAMIKIEQDDYENIPRKSINLRKIRGKGDDNDNDELHKTGENEEVQKSESRSPTSTLKSPKLKKSRNRELAGLCDSLTHYFIPNSLDTSVRTSVVTDDKSKSPKKLIDENIIIDKYNKNMKRKSLPNVCISENNKKGKKHRKSLESNEVLKKATFKKDVQAPQKSKKLKNGEEYSNDSRKTNINETSLRHNPSIISSELLYDLPTLPSVPSIPPHKTSHYPPWPSPFEENIQESLEIDSSDEDTDEGGSDVDIKKKNVEDESFQSIYTDQPPNLIDIHMWGLLDTPYMCNLLQTLNLIPKKKNCHNCGLEMILTKRNLSSVIDGLIWKCAGSSSCNETVGLRTGTIFERSQLSLTIILKMVHLFVSGNPIENIMNETNLKEDDVLGWMTFFKETLILHLLNNSEVVGDPGQTVDVGDAPVHNSPALFAYGIQDAQLLCGLGRETGKTFLVTYNKHFVKTEDGGEMMISDPPIDSLITQWVNPGSTIKTRGTEDYPILQDSLTYYHIDINRAKKPLKTQHRENICQNLPSMSLGYHTNGADLATKTFLDSCKIRKEAPFWNFLRATGVLY